MQYSSLLINICSSIIVSLVDSQNTIIFHLSGIRPQWRSVNWVFQMSLLPGNISQFSSLRCSQAKIWHIIPSDFRVSGGHSHGQKISKASTPGGTTPPLPLAPIGYPNRVARLRFHFQRGHLILQPTAGRQKINTEKYKMVIYWQKCRNPHVESQRAYKFKYQKEGRDTTRKMVGKKRVLC